MTGTAGFAVFHVFHGCIVRAALWLNQVGMATVATIKHLNVYGVREGNVTKAIVLEDDVPGMAPGAVAGTSYPESIRPVMAGTAGFSVLHCFHGCLICALLCFERVRMATVAALKHLNMDGVRKSDVANIFVFEGDVSGMASDAIAGNCYPESIRPVMTGTAGFSVLHGFHGCLVRSALCLIQVGMATVTTLKHFNVYGVREGNVADAFVLEDDVAGMAFSAVTCNVECLPAVVAGTAGLAPLHYFHADMVAVAFLLEEFWMTRITLGSMYVMAEDDCTDGPGLYVDFVHHSPDTPHSSIVSHTNGVQGGRQSDYQ